MSSAEAIRREIADLERQDWGPDDASRRGVVRGLEIALRIVEAG